ATGATTPPVDGPGLATLGPVTTVGAVVEFVLDGAITTDGTYDLAIDTTSNLAVQYYASSSTTGPPPALVLTVGNGAGPTVGIVQPPGGSTFFVGDRITFEGTAIDPVDGDLGAALTWRSDQDGLLGTGATITTPLREGQHTVTAAVTNQAGALGTAQVDVTVAPRPAANT